MSRPSLRILAISTVLAAAGAAHAADQPPQTDDQKTLYALGMAMSKNLAQFNLEAKDVPFVLAGIRDSLTGAPTHGIDLNEYQPKIQQMVATRRAAAAEAEKGASDAFLAEQAKAKGVVKTDSGLLYTELRPGTGPSPAATDRVKVHYHGTLRTGKVFDSSVERNEPATFGLNQVVPCWTEGVQRMKVGGKSRLVCPSAIAYGDRGAPGAGILPGSALMFEVELLEIVK